MPHLNLPLSNLLHETLKRRKKMRRTMARAYYYITNVYNMFQMKLLFNGSYKEDRGSLFTRRHLEKTRGNRQKLHWEMFHIEKGNNFFRVRTIIHFNNLPRDAVQSLSLELFKIWLARVLDHPIKAPFSQEKLDLLIPRDPFQHGLVCGSMIHLAAAYIQILSTLSLLIILD